MNHLIAKASIIVALSISSSFSTADAGGQPGIIQSCMPQLGGENILSIPSSCSYAIDSYLGSYMNSISDGLNSSVNSFLKDGYSESQEIKSCAISETMQTNISEAISNKLAAAGESTAKIEELIQETLADQYPC